MSVEQRVRVRLARDDRRALILAEAVRAIGAQGYRTLSINALARSSGLTTAGLLHHFGSKEQLLVEVLRERDRQDEIAVSGALPEAALPASRETARLVLRTIVRRNEAQPELVRLSVMLRCEALTADHPAHAYFVGRDRAVTALFADLVAAFAPDPAATGLHVSLMMNALQMHWLREECRFDLVAAWDRAAAMLLGDR